MAKLDGAVTRRVELDCKRSREEIRERPMPRQRLNLNILMCDDGSRVPLARAARSDPGAAALRERIRATLVDVLGGLALEHE